jgi:hypothetical protein
VDCQACGARHDEASWGELAVAMQIEASEVQSYVLRWPEEQFIEVRVCRCGQRLAARRTHVRRPA